MADREKVIKALGICAVGTNSCEKCPSKDKCHGVSNAAMAAAIELLKEQETVVRCKDCKFYDSETGICAKGITHGYAAEWFCADGERR